MIIKNHLENVIFHTSENRKIDFLNEKFECSAILFRGSETSIYLYANFIEVDGDLPFEKFIIFNIFPSQIEKTILKKINFITNIINKSETLLSLSDHLPGIKYKNNLFKFSSEFENSNNYFSANNINYNVEIISGYYKFNISIDNIGLLSVKISLL
ncbi:hypothetical protein [Pseudonocardia sp. TMWB2A]|uniref:hypothetical protein n=1 Tax=Pseudonocardia sp. TMWB2A TaxID=687430 RepID=UPI00307ECC48